jgi:hypothetical protein
MRGRPLKKRKLRITNYAAVLVAPISLAPRFSEFHSRVYYHNRFSGLLIHQQETAEAVGHLSGVDNTQLKQGVIKRIDTKHVVFIVTSVAR